jgi:predicted dehydrogenase
MQVESEEKTYDGGQDRRIFLRNAGGLLSAGLAQSMAAAAQEPAKRPLRVGLIGAGARGTYLGSAVSKLGEQGEGVEIVSVCDIYQPRLERAEARFKARGYAKTADMLRDKSIDAVVIATPDRHHVPNALEAIRAGKDVYMEKPVCHWAQFDKLKEFVHENRKRQRIVQVGTQFMADSLWERSAELLRSGTIGKPVHAQTCYFRRGDQGERGMKVDDPNAKPGVGVDWETFQADAPRREFSVSRLFQWRLYMDYSGGPLTDTYPHTLTPLLRVLDPGFPKKVVAVGGRYFYNHGRDVPDTFDLLIQYPQDLTVVFLGTFVNATPIDTVVRGSEGTMIKKPEGMMIEPPRGVNKPPQEVPADIASVREGHADLTVAHLKDFFDSVRTRKQPRGNLELAYIVQTPLIMAMQSHLHDKVAFFDADREVIRLT